MAFSNYSKEEETGTNSEGFKTIMFPAAVAPINGSEDTTIILLICNQVIKKIN